MVLNIAKATSQKTSKNAKRIVYIGNDTAYWKNIEQRYRTIYFEKDFAFQIFPAADKITFQATMCDVLLLRPHIVYVDLSYAKNFQLKVAHFLRRDNATRKIPLIGLVENKSMLKESLLTGMTFTHVKCGEYHDVVYDPYYMAFPSEVKKPKFARARFMKWYETQMVDDFLVSYFTPTYMHVEGNVKLSKGDKLRIRHNLPAKIMGTDFFVVKETSSQNMYYDYKYSYDLEYLFLESPVLDPKLANDPAQEKIFKAAQDQYLQELTVYKKKMKEWVKEHENGLEKKQIKVLAVDQDLWYLKNSKMTLNECSFAMRSQSFLSDDLEELERIMPNMIAYQFQEYNEELHKDLKEESIKALQDNEQFHLNRIEAIVKKCTKMTDYMPFIMIFGTKKYNSAHFQQKLSHPFILTNMNSMTLDLLSPMVKLLEQKINKKEEEKIKKMLMQLKAENPAKNSKLTTTDVRGMQYFVDQRDAELAMLSVSYDIGLKTLTESEITFVTEAELQISSYRVAAPIPMAVTVIPLDGKLFNKESGKLHYFALIHSLGEDDKRILRKEINEVFFSPLMEQRKKESEEFSNLNIQTLEKMNAPPPEPEGEAVPEGEKKEEKDKEKDSEKKPAG